MHRKLYFFFSLGVLVLVALTFILLFYLFILLFCFFHQHFSSWSVSPISFPTRQTVLKGTKHICWHPPSFAKFEVNQVMITCHQTTTNSAPYSIHLVYNNEIQSELPNSGSHTSHTRKASIILTGNIHVLPLTSGNFQHLVSVTFQKNLVVSNSCNKSKTKVPVPMAALPHKLVYNQ